MSKIHRDFLRVFFINEGPKVNAPLTDYAKVDGFLFARRPFTNRPAKFSWTVQLNSNGSSTLDLTRSK